MALDTNLYDAEYTPEQVGSGESYGGDFDEYADDNALNGQETDFGDISIDGKTAKDVEGEEKPPATSTGTIKAKWGDQEVEVDLSDKEMLETALTQALVGQQLAQEKEQWEAKYAELERGYAEAEETVNNIIQGFEETPLDIMNEAINEGRLLEDPKRFNEYKKWLTEQVTFVNKSDAERKQFLQQKEYERLMDERKASEQAAVEAKQAQLDAQRQEIHSKVQSWTNAQWEGIKAKVDTANLPAVQRLMRMLLSEASTRSNVDTDALTKELNELVKPYFKGDTTNRSNQGTKNLQSSVSGASNKVGGNSTNELSKKIAQARANGDIKGLMTLLSKSGLQV